MKQGIPINELAQKVAAQGKAKRDFIADSKCIRMKADGEQLHIDGAGINDLDFKISDICHRQLGTTLGIPAKYYDKLRESTPSLLAQNVNWWLHSDPKQQMVRTFDYSTTSNPLSFQDVINKGTDTARAFLSNRYRPLDNEDLINELLPMITDKGAEIKSCNLTDSHLYLHASFPSMEREIKKGDVVRSGVVIRNSEVGLSSLKVQPWIERLVCSNGMIVADSGVRKYHVGRNLSSGELAYELMSDSTKQQTDKAFWMQVQDVVKSTIEEAKFERVMEAYAKKAEVEVCTPARAVEVTVDKFGISEEEGKSMLQFLCEDGDYTEWGIANSITRLAHNTSSYDRAVELEEIGGNVMELPQKVWQD